MQAARVIRKYEPSLSETVINMHDSDSSEIYRKLLDKEVDHRCDVSALIRQAVVKFEADRKFDLLRLIQSEDPVIRGRGLVIFAELGKKGLPLLADVISFVRDGSDEDKADVLDAMLSYSNTLTKNSIDFILDAASSSNRLVRIRVMHLIELLPSQEIRAAVERIGSAERRREQMSGLEILQNDDLTLVQLVESYLTSKGAVSLYCGAAIFAAARRGVENDIGNLGVIADELSYILNYYDKLASRYNANQSEVDK